MSEPYVRVGGLMICTECGRSLNRHPREVKFTEMGEEVWFVRLCDGELGKL